MASAASFIPLLKFSTRKENIILQNVGEYQIPPQKKFCAPVLRVEGSGFDEFRVRIKVPLSGFRV